MTTLCAVCEGAIRKVGPGQWRHLRMGAPVPLAEDPAQHVPTPARCQHPVVTRPERERLIREPCGILAPCPRHH